MLFAKKKIFIISVVCMTSFLVASTPLSFHTLFPMTWYEKGLNATIFVWNTVCTLFDHDAKETSLEALDIMVGRCAFAHFCLEKMHQHKQYIIDEDIAYFTRLLYILKKKLLIIKDDSTSEDRFACLMHIINNMQRFLQIPTDIQPK